MFAQIPSNDFRHASGHLFPSRPGDSGPLAATRSRRRLGAGCCLLGMLVAAPPLLAQQPHQPSPSQPPSAVLAAQLRTTITTDTEAMVVGHTDFSRYTTPRFCLIAVQHARRVLGRSIAMQEAADNARRTDPAHDTLPAGVAPIARACAARFSVATAAPTELPALFELALLGQQDSLAAAVVARRLALATGTEARADLLLTVMHLYLAAAPTRVAAAEALAARLDALGQGGAGAAVLPSRVLAHQALLAIGDATADWPRIRHEVDAIRTLLHTVPAAQQGAYTGPLLAAYRSLLLLAARQAPDSVPAFARQLQAEAQQVAQAVGPAPPARNTALADLISYATVPVDSVLWHLAAVWNNGEGLSGQPTPPLEADVWFPAKDTVPPGQGHVSLYVELPEHCYESFWPPQVLDPIATGCQQMYDQIRGWAAQAGPPQLAITLVAFTVPRLANALLRAPQTPEAAAQNLDWYFRQYLKLPVQHVAVQFIPVAAPLPAPDGRLFPQALYVDWSELGLGDQTPFRQRYHAEPGVGFGNGLSVVLTGRDGRYWYGGGATVVFDRFLALALATPSALLPAPSRAPGPGTPSVPPVAAHP